MLLQLITAVIAGLVGGMLTELWLNRRKYQYRWKCPVCSDFTVEASSQEIVNRVKVFHSHEEA